MLQWLVLRVAPQKEFDTARHIARMGHEALCPFESKWRRKNTFSKHKIERPYPLFTRYVFAGIKTWPHDFVEIRDTITFVQGVIGVNGEPAFLSEAERAWIAAMGEANGDLKAIQHTVSVHKAIKVGTSVRITDGAWTGHVGPLNCIIGREAHVAVEIFNAMRLVKIPLAKLEPA